MSWWGFKSIGTVYNKLWLSGIGVISLINVNIVKDVLSYDLSWSVTWGELIRMDSYSVITLSIVELTLGKSRTDVDIANESFLTSAAESNTREVIPANVHTFVRCGWICYCLKTLVDKVSMLLDLRKDICIQSRALRAHVNTYRREAPSMSDMRQALHQEPSSEKSPEHPP